MIAFQYFGFKYSWIVLDFFEELDVLGLWILGYLDFASLNIHITKFVHKFQFQEFFNISGILLFIKDQKSQD